MRSATEAAFGPELRLSTSTTTERSPRSFTTPRADCLTTSPPAIAASETAEASSFPAARATAFSVSCMKSSPTRRTHDSTVKSHLLKAPPRAAGSRNPSTQS